MYPYDNNMVWPGSYNYWYPSDLYGGMPGPRPNGGDPPPVLSNRPPATSIVLFKELTGYPNYGNPSRNADILYTGTQGTWTFPLQAFLFIPGQFARAELVISGVLDDHYNVGEGLYSMTVNFNGVNVFTGRPPFVHGRPTGAVFNNWRQLRIPVQNLRRNNNVTIRNSSRAGENDWIGLDWMELRITPRAFQ